MTGSTLQKRLPLSATHTEIAALIAILTLAIALRFWGIGFGFPERLRPDEQYFVQAVQRMDIGGTLDPGWYYYPSLYMYLNLLTWRAYTLVQLFKGDYSPSDARRGQPPAWGIEQLRARAPNIEYLLGRIMTALFGAATVAVTYVFARRHYGRKAATAAALLLAVNGVHVLNSHFYKSDIATTFFTMLALLCMARFIEERRLRWNFGAAIATGLAASMNYYGGFLLAPLVASQVMAGFARPTPTVAAEERLPFETFGLWLAAGFRAIGRALIRWETWAMPLIAIAVFVLASPYVFIRWPEFLNTFHRMLFADRQSLYDAMVKHAAFEDYGFQRGEWLYSLRFNLRFAMGLMLALLSAVGLMYLAVRHRAVDILLLLFFLIHFLMIASGQAVFMRYWLSLIPILTIASGALLSWAAQKALPGKPNPQHALLSIALVIFGFESAWAAVEQDRLLTREDTRLIARRWIEKNLPPAAIGVPMDWSGDFYPYGKPSLPAGGRYVPVGPDEASAKGLRYLLIDSSPLRLYSPPDRPEWTRRLAANARLLYEISPVEGQAKSAAPIHDQLDAWYVPLARFRGIERPGPTIRIYEIK